MKPLIFGHRGSPLEAPENTILSISKAMEANVNAVEIDVHKTKDNKIVVIHDDKVDRTTNGKGFVKDFTLKQIKEFDSGNGQKIPTLQEVINFIKNKIRLVIEIKQKKIEKEVVEILEKNNLIEDVYVISFHHEIVKKVKELNNKIKTGILFMGNPISPSSLIRDAKADALSANHSFVDKQMVEKVHRNNLKFFVWNIDTIENLKKMIKLKVDGIGSNKPGLIVEYLKKQKSL